jgi:hypothetical protein
MFNVRINIRKVPIADPRHRAGAPDQPMQLHGGAARPGRREKWVGAGTTPDGPEFLECTDKGDLQLKPTKGDLQWKPTRTSS